MLFTTAGSAPNPKPTVLLVTAPNPTLFPAAAPLVTTKSAPVRSPLGTLDSSSRLCGPAITLTTVTSCWIRAARTDDTLSAPRYPGLDQKSSVYVGSKYGT